MWQRLAVFAIVIGELWTSGSCASGATIYAQLYPHTGEIRLRNKNAAPVSIVFYSINSPANALNGSPSIWKSIDNYYDVSGNGLVDPNGEWAIIRSLSNQLTEGALDADGGRLAPQRAITLGQVWNPNATPIQDLIFEARDASEQPISVIPELAVSGDYVPDGVVDQLDYNAWRQYFGETTILTADGNLDGRVDAADFIVWRNNLGLRLTAVGQGAGLTAVSAAVPEPAMLLLAACGSCGYLMFRMRRVSR
jgi:hypothetical protein